jgi:protein SCO1
MRFVLAIAAGAIVLAAGILLVASQVGGGDGTAAAGPSPFTGSVPPKGIELPSFALTDETGAPVTDADLRGRIAVVTFLDAQCEEACPVIGEITARADDRLEPSEREQVAIVGITVDPAGDTPDRVAAFLRRHRANGRLSYLVGDEKELTRVWRDFSVLPVVASSGHDIHSAPVRIYGRDGEWLTTLNSGVDLSVESLVHDVRAALDQTSG